MCRVSIEFCAILVPSMALSAIFPVTIVFAAISPDTIVPSVIWSEAITPEGNLAAVIALSAIFVVMTEPVDKCELSILPSTSSAESTEFVDN